MRLCCIQSDPEHQSQLKGIRYFLRPTNSLIFIDISEIIVNFALAQNLLRSPENYFSLSEISDGINKKGEKLRDGDLIIEIDKSAIGFNDRVQQHIITIPKERVIASDKNFTQVVDDIMKEYASSFGGDQTKLKSYRSKIEAKVKWIRSL
jgi:hypothetical protein